MDDDEFDGDEQDESFELEGYDNVTDELNKPRNIRCTTLICKARD